MVYLTFISIALISLFTFFPSFNLALFGDDWLAFFRYAQHLGPKSSGDWNHLAYFLTPYGAQDILMGILRNFFGFESTLYYVISFILRLLASFSFYPLVKYLTGSRLASIFAVVFFSVTTTGLDTTNWVFNMPTYITITLFNLFLYFFLRSREEKSFNLLPLSTLFYYLAYVITPIRMHGSLPLIFLLEVFWVIQERNNKTIKKALIRLVAISVVFLIIRFTGHSQGPSQEVSERFGLGIKTMSEMLQVGRFDFIFYPISMFGSMFIPDFILPFTQPLGRLTNLLIKLILPTLLGFSLLVYIISKNIPSQTFKFMKFMLLGEVTWSLVISIIFKTNLITFSDPRLIFLSLIGGYILILGVFLLLYFFKRSSISNAIFSAIAWSVLSFFFAWWWVPTSIFPTTYRYLIVSAVGVSILLATLISLGKTQTNRLFLFAIFTPLIIIHIFATRAYLEFASNSHGQEISKKIWSSIPHINDVGKDKKPLVFYFEGDGTNGAILHDVITFGFPPHMALLYNLREENPLPIPMSNWQEVISTMKDGKTLPAYGYPPTPTTPDRVFAFILQGKDNLINVTDLARKKLLDSL
ncbi:hypothetical protein HYZ05_02980 [Candidatus Daviesbacteria bacterium]|nr:hypothetical protein [Candidatus Daviesbacteria bacterium]